MRIPLDIVVLMECRSTVPQEVPKIESSNPLIYCFSNPLIYCFILCIMWTIGHYSIIFAIHRNVFVGFYHKLVTWAFQLVFFFFPSAASPVDNGSIKSMVEMMALYRILHLSRFCIFKCLGNQCAWKYSSVCIMYCYVHMQSFTGIFHKLACIKYPLVPLPSTCIFWMFLF